MAEEILEVCYIPHDERERYEAQGWTVTKWGNHHDSHSLKAVRTVEE